MNVKNSPSTAVTAIKITESKSQMTPELPHLRGPEERSFPFIPESFEESFIVPDIF
jgi:hypothetical protein